MSAKCDIKWMWDLVFGIKKQNAADHQFLQNNGLFYILFDKFLSWAEVSRAVMDGTVIHRKV